MKRDLLLSEFVQNKVYLILDFNINSTFLLIKSISLVVKNIANTMYAHKQLKNVEIILPKRCFTGIKSGIWPLENLFVLFKKIDYKLRGMSKHSFSKNFLFFFHGRARDFSKCLDKRIYYCFYQNKKTIFILGEGIKPKLIFWRELWADILARSRIFHISKNCYLKLYCKKYGQKFQRMVLRSSWTQYPIDAAIKSKDFVIKSIECFSSGLELFQCFIFNCEHNIYLVSFS